MTLEEIKTLHERCLSGVATPEEQYLFEEYKDQFDLNDIAWTSDMGDREQVKNRLRKDLGRRMKQRQVIRWNRFYRPAAAASILILLGLSWIMLRHKTLPKPVSQLSRIQPGVVKPGGNKAILILANSRSIILDSSKLGKVATQSNTLILKNQKQLLQYSQNSMGASNSVPQFNTLITPRGGQYQLQLSDGTKVWLNAESQLRFPVNFSGKERLVELTGEAYFEVAKNKNMPFKVITGSKTVEVLGTHFNVSAYPNDTYRATLLEGSVKLDAVNGGSAVLIPGQQGVFTVKSKFNVLKADTVETVAWKNGIFLFKNDGIDNVMKQISRWYDVDITYREGVSHVKLAGTVSRYANIASLLNTIQLTGSVHFKLEGRRVIVMR